MLLEGELKRWWVEEDGSQRRFNDVAGRGDKSQWRFKDVGGGTGEMSRNSSKGRWLVDFRVEHDVSYAYVKYMYLYVTGGV
jgi:hypothetical protein